ncbi:hypothetical protein [Streptomyces sp. NPDC048825]|uniref:hypothetical protein n=1 Tax=Streptomyces sp. NPDC048825 TaxID=3365592 RepID=UPI00371139E2
MLKRIARIAAVPAAVVLGLAAGTGPAYAGTNTEAYLVTGGYTVGSVHWTANGDSLLVCDQRKNGEAVWGAVEHYETGNVFDSLYNNAGSGSCLGLTVNLVEGTYIKLKVCSASGGNVNWDDCEYSPRGRA